MNDPDIIKLYLERDERAINESRAKYGAYLASIARRILPDRRDAEEVVSDAYLACWRSIPPNRPEELSSYLGRLCRNGAIDRAKRESRLKRGSGEYDAVLCELSGLASEGPDRAMEAEDFNRALNGFLKGLNKKPRRVFVQRYWYLLPVKEIAAQNGMSEAAVKMQLSRTRAELKELLIKEGLYYE